MQRGAVGSGLEGAPDIMLLIMAALMVAIVWLVSHAHESTLPPIELPRADEASLGSGSAGSVSVTLRPARDGSVEVWVEDARVPGDLDGLEQALRGTPAAELVLRADASTRWEDTLRAMNTAAALGLPLAVASGP